MVHRLPVVSPWQVAGLQSPLNNLSFARPPELCLEHLQGHSCGLVPPFAWGRYLEAVWPFLVPAPSVLQRNTSRVDPAGSERGIEACQHHSLVGDASENPRVTNPTQHVAAAEPQHRGMKEN